MTSQFWIGGGHCWESWGIPRPGVHVLFWWPCPHGRRLTTGQSRGGDRPLLSSQSTSAGQLQPLWHGPGGWVLSTPLPSSEWKKWIAVNIERARLFVCFLWGPVAPGRSLRGNRSTWLSAGGSQVAAILPPCTTPHRHRCFQNNVLRDCRRGRFSENGATAVCRGGIVCL